MKLSIFPKSVGFKATEEDRENTDPRKVMYIKIKSEGFNFF